MIGSSWWSFQFGVRKFITALSGRGAAFCYCAYVRLPGVVHRAEFRSKWKAAINYRTPRWDFSVPINSCIVSAMALPSRMKKRPSP